MRTRLNEKLRRLYSIGRTCEGDEEILDTIFNLLAARIATQHCQAALQAGVVCVFN